jgi:hypothetical protein
MPAAPPRPAHHLLGGRLDRQDHAPQEAPYLRHTPRGGRPRVARNAARRCCSAPGGRLLFHASPAIIPARTTANWAKAHLARVMWRDHPVPLRPASCSRPTSPVATSQRGAMTARVPATRTTSASVVSWGAKTTSPRRALGSLTRRRPSSQRRQLGSRGSARGRHRQSSQRGPVAPSPALRRVPPSSGRVAKLVCTCRGRQFHQTYSVPDPAKT